MTRWLPGIYKDKIIYINRLETEPPLRQFTDQTTEATISKFGSGMLYTSIRMKMGIIKSVLIKQFPLYLGSHKSHHASFTQLLN